MSRLTMRFAEADGTTLIDFMPTEFTKYGSGVYMSSYSLGFPVAKEVVQDAPQRNGQYDLTCLYGARQFTAEVKVFDTRIAHDEIIANVSAPMRAGPYGSESYTTKTRHEIADFLRSLCRPDRRIFVYIRQDGWPTERRMMLRGQPVASVVDRLGGIYIPMSLAWNCPTGIIEEAELQSSTQAPDTMSFGMSFPMTFPMSFTPGGDTGSQTLVTNIGTAPAPPTLRIMGYCKNPIIKNHTTGNQFKLTNITIPAGQYLEINVSARTVYMMGDPSLSFYGRIDWTASQWWELEPGDNNISMLVSTNSATSSLEIYWRSWWL